MTPQDVRRTAYSYSPPMFFPDGTPMLAGDINEICPSCKSDGCERIVDPIDLRPFRDVYGEASFKAFQCHDCGARFSVYGHKTE